MRASSDKPAILIRNLTKSFIRRSPGRERVIPVDNVSIEISVDELVVLLGPSGCGKTTLLRCVAGLEVPDAGEIILDGRTVFSSEKNIFVPPEQRGISMIFQSYALWPHMTVGENVAFPLRARNVQKSEIDARVNEAIENVGLAGLNRSYPNQISGGQQQRVALARAIVGQEKVVLFDEPLSNVDAKVRERLRVELLEIKRKLGFSALYVTHDQSEAMELADRIAVLSNGKVSQYDTPRTVYHRPANSYVGSFIGSANMLTGRLAQSSDAGKSGEAAFDSELGRVVATSGPTRDGAEHVLLSRPENWKMRKSSSDENSWEGTIEAVLFNGAFTDYRVRVKDKVIQVLSSDSDLAAPDERVWISVPARHLLAMPAENGAAT